jgi:hypothetical protein
MLGLELRASPNWNNDIMELWKDGFKDFIDDLFSIFRLLSPILHHSNIPFFLNLFFHPVNSNAL